MYATIVTHSDIAFAVSQLAHFLTNSGLLHQAAANQTLLYLKRYRDLSLKLNKSDEYVMTSDASFADNTMN